VHEKKVLTGAGIEDKVSSILPVLPQAALYYPITLLPSLVVSFPVSYADPLICKIGHSLRTV
jgi:hypothetical protein